MDRRTTFDGWLLPVCLVLPQLLLTGFFFYWPAGEALWFSLTTQDAFGQGSVCGGGFSAGAGSPGQDQQAAEEDEADDDCGGDRAGLEGQAVVAAGGEEADEGGEQAEGDDGG